MMKNNKPNRRLNPPGLPPAPTPDKVPAGVRPDVLNVDDVIEMVPRLKGHEKLVRGLLRFLSIDRVNATHGRWCDTPGAMFCKRMVEQEFRLEIRLDNGELLDHLPPGAFITVSNHPFGAMDGITLIYLFAQRRPEFKVMVNMTLNRLSAMRPNFIAVDALSSDEPEKRRVSMEGIRQVFAQLKKGEPVGFFPAGAISKIDWRGRLHDREWQPAVLRIIKKARVPVIPVYFHGSNSWWFNILGVVCWQARTLRLPAEVFRKKKMHISLGQPITPEEQDACPDPESLGRLLREKTYQLRKLR